MTDDEADVLAEMYLLGISGDDIWGCEGCGQTYNEYVNGCVVCWDSDLTIDQNHAKYPRRSVRLIVPGARSRCFSPTPGDGDAD